MFNNKCLKIDIFISFAPVEEGRIKKLKDQRRDEWRLKHSRTGERAKNRGLGEF